MRLILASQERWIYAVTRILVGVLFACHGAQKVLGMFIAKYRKAAAR